ncbi:tyrosine-type recombinase/integrase [Urechidicola croceus]|uniref:Integrase n=1 Tax=Urechidicola croceus TaxID=1850246 RepID=A0A1D8P8A0_9FLAO|nr:site-specific integrase [Urechidicola croceus]AOW20761.1 hypothetical protein LPB138_08765 [Urechidicola croceus]
MSTLNELVTFEHEIEHDLEHDLLLKKNFSHPKIYIANGDINKRWYVYFSYRNPETGKLQRIKNIYGIVNNYHTKEERMSVLSVYRRKLLKLLKAGYNPFLDNTEVHDQSKKKVEKKVEVKEKSKVLAVKEVIPDKKEKPSMSIREAFEFGLNLKVKVISESTMRGYENRVKLFLAWIDKNHKELKSINDLNKRVVAEYLNSVLDKSSARNRNNYRIDLSSVLQAVVDNDIIEQNFIKEIPVLRSVPERNKTYNKEVQEEIFEYLETEDPILLLFIKFIGYNFLRPIEVCRLKIKDINLNNNTIQFKAKNSPLKTKIIPEILLSELPDLSKLDKNHFLFTPKSIGGKWDSSTENRRDHFTKRFKTVVKDHFNLGTDYGLYSFRHTYITKLYRKLVEDSSPFEAKSKLMLITGHTSMTALEKYLRDIDAELPQDYSHLLK